MTNPLLVAAVAAGGAAFAGNLLDHSTDRTLERSPFPKYVGPVISSVVGDRRIATGAPWNVLVPGVAVGVAAGVLALLGHASTAGKVAAGGFGAIALAETAHQVFHHSSFAPWPFRDW